LPVVSNAIALFAALLVFHWQLATGNLFALSRLCRGDPRGLGGF
jgi:hypothetical protein